MNVIPVLRRVAGGKGLIIIIIGRKVISLRPKTIRIPKAKRKIKGFTIIPNLSLRPILYPKFLRPRLVRR